MTVEEKAEEYAKNYTKSDIGMGEKFRTAKHFIAGYNMRDGESQWVSAKTNPPKESGRYWCYSEYSTENGISHEQLNCSYSDKHGFMENMESVNVTHWQNLPQPPKNI